MSVHFLVLALLIVKVADDIIPPSLSAAEGVHQCYSPMLRLRTGMGETPTSIPIKEVLMQSWHAHFFSCLASSFIRLVIFSLSHLGVQSFLPGGGRGIFCASAASVSVTIFARKTTILASISAALANSCTARK